MRSLKMCPKGAIGDIQLESILTPIIFNRVQPKVFIFGGPDLPPELVSSLIRVRPHKTLANPYPRTPAMAAGVTDHVWSVEEVVALIDQHPSAA